MGDSNRKYFYADSGKLHQRKKNTFLVFWREDKTQKLSKSAGPYTDFQDAEKIMIEYLSNGVCSWIVSYNG